MSRYVDLESKCEDEVSDGDSGCGGDDGCVGGTPDSLIASFSESDGERPPFGSPAEQDLRGESKQVTYFGRDGRRDRPRGRVRSVSGLFRPAVSGQSSSRSNVPVHVDLTVDEDAKAPRLSARIQGSRGRHWCFTSYLASPPVYNQLFMHYLLFQRELCPRTLREHWQGYVEMLKASRPTDVQRLLALPGCHVEARRGSREEARAYCKKLESRAPGSSPQEFGTWRESAQGSRSDLASVASLVADRSRSLSSIANEAPVQWIRYNRGIQSLRNILAPPRRERTRLFLYIGDSGTGKSYDAIMGDIHTGSMSVYVVPEITSGFMNVGSVWFNDYDGEEIVVFDNAPAPFLLSYEFLLRMADMYPLRVPTKGSFVNFNPKLIIITSKHRPTEWWPLRSEFSELNRRVTKIVHYESRVVRNVFVQPLNLLHLLF